MPRAYSAYTDVAGCKLWVDCLSGVTLSGSNAIVLADQSGAGLFTGVSVANAIATGLAAATGPTYSASDANFGGTPSLSFDGVNNALETETVAAQGGTWTFLTCLRMTGDQSIPRAFFAGVGGAATANNLFAQAPGSTGSVVGTTDAIYQMGPTLSKVAVVPSLGATAHVLCGTVLQGANGFGSVVLYKDGIVVAQGSWPNATPRTLTGLRLGHTSTNASAANFVGQLNAHVAWNVFFSAGQVAMMSALMARRHGVSLAGRVAS